MGEPHYEPETGDRKSEAGMFSGPRVDPPQQRRLLIGVAGAAVVAAVLIAVMLLQTHRPAGMRTLNTELPVDAYAANLTFTQLAMSQSTSLSGGTSTFIDGHVRNIGARTLTGVTLQVLFRNDEGLAPQVETLPLSLIRTHEPYVDTEPVSVAPLKAGAEVEFRLIFESIPANWNQQLPDLRVVGVSIR